MAVSIEPPRGLRCLGRSRAYSPRDIPGRLLVWHAPRPGRWERLLVTRGVLGARWQTGAAVLDETFDSSKTTIWFAPGTRWKVVHTETNTRFELEVYAEATPEHTVDISSERAALLASAGRVCLEGFAALEACAGTMKIGENCIIHGSFDWQDVRSELTRLCDDGFSWHPLAVDDGGFMAFMMRTGRPVDLVDYLARDHAVIESALHGLLYGKEPQEYAAWLRSLLVRHIRIEEELIFPCYLNAGGRAAWVRSLEIEHVLIRRSLDSLASKRPTEKLVRVLDSHDEKEERIVYPDVACRLVPYDENLARAALLFP